MDQDNDAKLTRLVKAIDSVLKRIPGNGSKTAIGAAILAALPKLVEAFPQLLMLSPYLDLVAIALTLVGLAHKPIKVLVSSLGDVTVLARDGKPGVESAKEE